LVFVFSFFSYLATKSQRTAKAKLVDPSCHYFKYLRDCEFKADFIIFVQLKYTANIMKFFTACFFRSFVRYSVRFLHMYSVGNFARTTCARGKNRLKKGLRK
jgi:hypothetical protein